MLRNFNRVISSLLITVLLFGVFTGLPIISKAAVTEVTDVLTRDTTGVTGTSYAAWTNKTSFSEAVYAGQSAGGNSSIQLRTTNSNSGVITTSSGGRVKKVAVTWNTNTSSGRTINIYGKNTAYSNATDLYNTSKQGTLLGTIKYGTSTELEIDDEYEYLGIRSSSGALYLSEIRITWESGEPDYDGFTVTWKNWDNTVLETDKDVDSGSTPEYNGSTPTKPGDEDNNYVFSGWSPEVSAISEDTTYVAQFDTIPIIKHTATWKNWDGSVLDTEVYIDGQTPTYKGDKLPTRAKDSEYSYSFSGWSPSPAPISEDTVYTAQYISQPIGDIPDSVNGVLPTNTNENFKLTGKYYKDTNGNVGFFSSDGVFKEDTKTNTIILSGVSVANIDTTKKLAHTVYVTGSGTQDDPYVFVTNYIYGDTNATAFKNSTAYASSSNPGDGYVGLCRIFVGNDSLVTFEASPDVKLKGSSGYVGVSKTQYGYAYAGTSITAVSGNGPYDLGYNKTLYYTGQDDEGTYHFSTDTLSIPKEFLYGFIVTWKNYDGSVLREDKGVEAGTIPSYSGTPTKPSNSDYRYEFTGWSPEITEVSDNVTYTAQYNAIERAKYTVTWVDYDGRVLDEEIYSENDFPSFKQDTPTRPDDATYTYTFKEWTPILLPVTGNTTYTADYNKAKIDYCTVKWLNWDNEVLAEELYRVGETPVYNGDTPTKAEDSDYSYSFSGWDNTPSPVTEDTTYKAQFESTEKIKYKIIWKNWNGTVLETDSKVEPGAVPTYNGATPTKPSDTDYTYEFERWSPEITEVTENKTYTAQFLKTPKNPIEPLEDVAWVFPTDGLTKYDLTNMYYSYNGSIKMFTGLGTLKENGNNITLCGITVAKIEEMNSTDMIREFVHSVYVSGTGSYKDPFVFYPNYIYYNNKSRISDGASVTVCYDFASTTIHSYPGDRYKGTSRVYTKDVYEDKRVENSIQFLPDTSTTTDTNNGYIGISATTYGKYSGKEADRTFSNGNSILYFHGKINDNLVFAETPAQYQISFGEATTYTIKYNLDGGTTADGKTVIEDKTALWADSNLIPDTAPVKTGFSFMGWSYEDTSVESSTTVGNLDPDETTLVLVANWKMKILGSTLYLGSKIGVNFYVDFGAKLGGTAPNYTSIIDTSLASKYSMHFTLKDKNGNILRTEVVAFDENEVNFMNVNGEIKPLYRFTHWNKSFEMSDIIEATIYKDSTPASNTKTYSILTYANNMIGKGNTALDNCLKGMLNYGAQSQLYWNHSTDYLATDTEKLTDSEKNVSSVDLSKYAPVKVKNIGGITDTTVALSFKDGLGFDMKIGFATDNSIYLNNLSSATLSSATVPTILKNDNEVSVSGNGYSLMSDIKSSGLNIVSYDLTIEDIPVFNWDDNFTLKLKDSSGSEYSVKFCLLSYGYAINGTGDKAENLLKAMAMFNSMSEAYFNSLGIV